MIFMHLFLPVPTTNKTWNSDMKKPNVVYVIVNLWSFLEFQPEFLLVENMLKIFLSIEK